MFNIPLKTGSSSAITSGSRTCRGGWCSLSSQANKAVTATNQVVPTPGRTSGIILTGGVNKPGRELDWWLKYFSFLLHGTIFFSWRPCQHCCWLVVELIPDLFPTHLVCPVPPGAPRACSQCTPWQWAGLALLPGELPQPQRLLRGVPAAASLQRR